MQALGVPVFEQIYAAGFRSSRPASTSRDCNPEFCFERQPKSLIDMSESHAGNSRHVNGAQHLSSNFMCGILVQFFFDTCEGCPAQRLEKLRQGISVAIQRP